MTKKTILCLAIVLLLIPASLFAYTKTYTVTDVASFQEALDAIYYEPSRTPAEDFLAVIDIKDSFEITEILSAEHGANPGVVYNKNGVKVFVTINGNGNTLTFAFDSTYCKKYALSFKTSGTVDINDLDIVLTENSQRGIMFQGTGKATLNNVTVKAEHESELAEAYKGVLVQNNWSDLTVKGTCRFTTDVTCWAAFDVDNTSGDGILNFACNAKVAFVDGRKAEKKADEPLVKLDDNSVENELKVVGSEYANLHAVEHGAKCGYDTHDWIYVVSGNTIEAVCRFDDCTYHYHPVSVSLNVYAKTMTIGTTITPDFAENKTLSWTSSNETVATVNQNGVVTAVGLGTTTIKAMATDFSDKYDICVVTVIQ